uniref:Uncharacterized protein n=1 Tax=Strigamia maritima TaxID=126957 RepID=T1JNW4_STRMM
MQLYCIVLPEGQWDRHFLLNPPFLEDPVTRFKFTGSPFVPAGPTIPLSPFSPFSPGSPLAPRVPNSPRCPYLINNLIRICYTCM